MTPLTSRFSNISGGSGGSGFGRRRLPKIVYTAANAPLGAFAEGGYVICKSTGIAWIVAPISSEVSRNWYSRNDANTRAQQVSGCTGWFVPSCNQLQSPGYACRTYWDSYSSSAYWSSTENYPGSYDALYVNFTNSFLNTGLKSTPICVRSFRCVTY